MLDSRGAGRKPYSNPVYLNSFPDPFVLKYSGEYFAYCTGFAGDGNVFGVARSYDLVEWNDAGGAMTPLENSPPYYWAPEVFYDNGQFFLYYSVGNEVLMEIRVAVSDRPGGGFVDAGYKLTHEDFAIDAHVFVDDDETRYLFYATDFLEHSHIGTGTVVDRMIDPFTLEGKPRPVTRARYDWQVYDPVRKEKGGVRWHTVEGPTVLKRKGIYYEMFSGGNWQNTTYGVSFAVSESMANTDEWLQYSDGENVLPILRTIPDSVIGPGHNSVIRGPNNRELYCVYHRWTDAGRVMAIDRMDFAGSRIFVIGATNSPQPAPFVPGVRELFQSSPLDSPIVATGQWEFSANGAVPDRDKRCEVVLNDLPESCLMEVTWSVDEMSENARAGLSFEGVNMIDLIFDPTSNAMELIHGASISRLALPVDFDWNVRHLLRIEIDHRRLSVQVDHPSDKTNILIDRPLEKLTIYSEGIGLRLYALELTEGYEELFVEDSALEENGWSVSPDRGYRIGNGEMMTEGSLLLQKGRPLESFEIAANVRTIETNPTSGEVGLVITDESGEMFRFVIDPLTSSFTIEGNERSSIPVPDEVELSQYHQLRIVKLGEIALLYFDDACLGEYPIMSGRATAAVMSEGVAATVEMVRLTSLDTFV